MNAAAVTLCLGTWNAAAFVEATLRSLMAQSHPQLQVLIADDASGDDTVERCRRIVGDDPRFVLQRRPRNLGWCRNYAALLQEVRTPYVCFAFHDDQLHPQAIARLLEALASSPEAVLAYGDLSFGTNAFVPLPGHCRCLDRVPGLRRRLARLIRMRGSWWIPFRGVMRTEAARRCADCLDLPTAAAFSADWIWLIRLAMEGQFVRVPQQLVVKNWLASGVTVSSSWRLAAEVRLRQRCLQTLRQRRPAGWRVLSLLTLAEIALLPLRRIVLHGHATLAELQRRCAADPQAKGSGAPGC